MNAVLDVVILIVRLIYYTLEAWVLCFIPRQKRSVVGKVILITGAGGGFGREMASMFAKLGARLALVDINEASVSKTADELQRLGVTAHSYKCDVTKVEDVKIVGQKVRADLGTVDILVNNAGIMRGKSLLKLSEQEIRQTMEVNLLSHFWMVREFLPDMLNARSGHIIAVCSMAGREAIGLLTDYGASKFGVNGFMENLEAELHMQRATDYIRLTTVYPMAANTNLVNGIAGHCAYEQRFDPLLSPTNVAEAIVEGSLRGKRLIYVPARMQQVNTLGCIMPIKVKRILSDFIAPRFVETRE